MSPIPTTISARFERAAHGLKQLVESMTSVPSAARAVIIGGGIIGCSTAYHLARWAGATSVLLERHKLTSGSTWHAAGLRRAVAHLRQHHAAAEIQRRALRTSWSRRLGQATGWKMQRRLCGSPATPERLTEIKRQATTAHSFGLEMHLLTPAEAKALWPVMDIGDLVGAAFLPTDGQANPADIAAGTGQGRAAGVAGSSRAAGSPAISESNAAQSSVSASRRARSLPTWSSTAPANGRGEVGPARWRFRAAAIRPAPVSR